MQTLNQIREQANISRNLWVKVLGMLQQNWCRLEMNPSGSADLIFFDDRGVVFDWLVASDPQSAEAALRANQFCWMWEHSSFFHAAGVPVLPGPGTRQRSRPVYSSGEYWTQPGLSQLQGEVHAHDSIGPRADDDLERFVAEQDGCWYTIVEEIASGHKQTHWMWFIFPQLRGLGSSRLANYFGLSSPREAAEYWDHPVLGDRLRSCIELLLELPAGAKAEKIFGSVDARKLQSCMSLFANVSPESAGVREVLGRYFDAERCPLTEEIIKNSAPARRIRISR